MEDGRVRSSYGHGRYGFVAPKVPDIVAISVLHIRLPHHTIGDGILRDSHQMLPALKSRVLTTVEASQVSAFCLGKGHFDCIQFSLVVS